MANDFRIVHHTNFEGARGEFELQWMDSEGDWQNVAFSSSYDTLVAITKIGG